MICVLSYLLLCLINIKFKVESSRDFIPFYFAIVLIKKLNNYLTKNNLKQMNLKILGKAMGFMFLPTLSVLLLLTVGFFDPVAMWVWIKSSHGWAVFTRIVIFAAEIGLTTLLYFYYLQKDREEQVKKDAKAEGSKRRVSYDQYAYRLFPDGESGYYFYVQQTEDPNIQLLIREPK